MNDKTSLQADNAVIADGLKLLKVFRVIDNPERRREVIALARLYAEEGRTSGNPSSD